MASAVENTPEVEMNWDLFEGKWKQMKGSVRQQWGRLTDDDVEMIGGAKDRLLGRLQERYGWSREEAERNADEWYRTQHEVEPTHTR